MTDEHWAELFERLERLEWTVLALAEWFDIQLRTNEEEVSDLGPDNLRRGANGFRKLIAEVQSRS